ncbi:hypothetical protein MKZ38_003774 [Zalerion maritima]|uniref:Uncharacterized protein n=1 Tax=Zalerion maritima TaxID=339359 RepID=A0AAD5RNJ4_9PEZI|nr:hypothetical protein MKZ38_003774 [Zalerion maritima]
MQLSYTKESSCTPFNFMYAAGYHEFYSPGICPKGYTVGCYAWTTYFSAHDDYYAHSTSRLGWVDEDETAAKCVPSSYYCVANLFHSASRYRTGTYSYAPAIEIRWKSSDIEQAILETHPLRPGVFLSTSTTSSTSPTTSFSSSSSTTTSAFPTCTGSSSSCGSSSSSSSSYGGGFNLSLTGKICIAVGSVVAGALILWLLMWCIRRKREKELHVENAKTQPVSTGGNGPRLIGGVVINEQAEDEGRAQPMAKQTVRVKSLGVTAQGNERKPDILPQTQMTAPPISAVAGAGGSIPGLMEQARSSTFNVNAAALPPAATREPTISPTPTAASAGTTQGIVAVLDPGVKSKDVSPDPVDRDFAVEKQDVSSSPQSIGRKPVVSGPNLNNDMAGFIGVERQPLPPNPAQERVEMDGTSPSPVIAELSERAERDVGIRPGEVTWTRGNVAVPPSSGQYQRDDYSSTPQATYTPQHEATGWGALGGAMSPTKSSYARNPPLLSHQGQEQVQGQYPGQQQWQHQRPDVGGYNQQHHPQGNEGHQIQEQHQYPGQQVYRYSHGQQPQHQVPLHAPQPNAPPPRYSSPMHPQQQWQDQGYHCGDASRHSQTMAPRDGRELGDLMKRQNEIQARKDQLKELQRMEEEEEAQLRERIESLQGDGVGMH